jgi:hypothetical protein
MTTLAADFSQSSAEKTRTRVRKHQVHHYIPQFILRYWVQRQVTRERQARYRKLFAFYFMQSSQTTCSSLCRKNGKKPPPIIEEYISTHDFSTSTTKYNSINIRDVYCALDYYRDSESPEVHPYHVERALSVVECSAAPIITKLHNTATSGQTYVTLDHLKLDVLHKFLFLCLCRTERGYREQFFGIEMRSGASDFSSATSEARAELELHRFCARHKLGSVRAAWLRSLAFISELPANQISASQDILPSFASAFGYQYERSVMVFYVAPASAEFILSENSLGVPDDLVPGHHDYLTPIARSYPLTPKLAVVFYPINYGFVTDRLHHLLSLPQPASKSVAIDNQQIFRIYQLDSLQVAHINALTLSRRDDIFVFKSEQQLWRSILGRSLTLRDVVAPNASLESNSSWERKHDASSATYNPFSVIWTLIIWVLSTTLWIIAAMIILPIQLLLFIIRSLVLLVVFTATLVFQIVRWIAYVGLQCAIFIFVVAVFILVIVTMGILAGYAISLSVVASGALVILGTIVLELNEQISPETAEMVRTSTTVYAGRTVNMTMDLTYDGIRYMTEFIVW